MLRKTLHMSVVISLLLAVIMPASVAMAQQPLPPQTSQDQPNGPSKIDLKSLPEVVQKAVQLQQSLSPSQQAALRQLLDQYQPEMMAIAAVDMAGRAPVAAPTGLQPEVKEPAAKLAETKLPEAKLPETKRMDGNQAVRMTTVLNKVDAGMAAILNADQLNLYRAVMNPDFAGVKASELPKSAGPALVSKPDSAPSAQSGYTDNCLYGAYYGAVAKYYENGGYVWAATNYFYWGTTYGLYAYTDAWYAFVYGTKALNYAAPLYFAWYYTGLYTPGDPYEAYYNAYYGYYNGYYGYTYASLDHTNTSHTTASNAEWYLYYAYTYANNAQSYSYYCYYNS